jgi:hypothetical protein
MLTLKVLGTKVALSSRFAAAATERTLLYLHEESIDIVLSVTWKS